MSADPRCTPELVSWCYRVFLGRDPESAWVVQDKLQRLNALVDICDEFIDSAEFISDKAIERRAATPATAEVCAWATRLVLGEEPTPVVLAGLIRLASLDEVLQTLRRQTRVQCQWPAANVDEPRKVALLGNCQTDSLRGSLQHYTHWQVVNWREHVLVDPVEQARIRRELTQADIIITQQLSVGRCGELFTSELIAAGMPVVVIPNLYFAGLHPELVYLGPLGQRLQSPLGDYHSALACAAFLAGLTPEDALACYEDDALFEQAGLFDAWASSWSEYVAREFRCDVKMADYLDAASHDRPLFYSVNHPVGAVMDELARRIVRHVTGQDVLPQFMRDDLQNDIIYPVWGPIVRRQRLAYGSRVGFYLRTPENFLPLPGYLHQVYTCYAEGLDGVELPVQVLRLREILSARHPVSIISSPGATERATDVAKSMPAVVPSMPQPRRRWWPFGR